MPGFDRTGPLGYGPMTGRGMGPCGAGFRRGSGRGMGMGRGFRAYGPGPAYMSARAHPPERAYGREQAPTREQEIADLRAEKELLERDLKEIGERIKELESKK